MKLKNTCFQSCLWDGKTLICAYIYICIRKSSFFESKTKFQKAVFETQNELLLSLKTAQKRDCLALFKLLFSYFLVMRKNRNRSRPCKNQCKTICLKLKNRLKQKLFLKLQKSCVWVCFWDSKKLMCLWFLQCSKLFSLLLNANKLLKSC